MKVRFRNKLESFVRCEEQLWPDCGGPSNTFLPPHAVRGGRATQTYLGFRPKLKATVHFKTLVGSDTKGVQGAGGATGPEGLARGRELGTLRRGVRDPWAGPWKARGG